ncbi:hypothetical protein MMC11_004858 [Xylographa trunciseda]|nr:hypothetical protein [Xylographa trunciseda]
MPYPSPTNSARSGSKKTPSDIRWPTRTIDVGPPEGTSEPFLSINNQKNEQSFQNDKTSRSWVALSHCWGGHSPVMTIVGNMHEMKKAIPMSILPPLFRDAVIITRRLGFRHLWIDSLCIVQDSPEDWDHEVTQMGNIYASSVLNIAADSSRNCDDSILGRRHVAFPPIEITFKSHHHHINGTMFVRPCLDSWKAVLQYESNLSPRAWVLQESMLASRTLHFCKQQILWECRSLRIAESCLTPISAPIPGLRKVHNDDWSLNKQFLLFVIVKGEAGSAEKARDILYLQWYTVVEQYSLRKLTVLNDKLPALASLACCFRDLLEDSYHCGLFGSDLHRGLLWQTQDRLSARYATSYRAPSWSWASVDGPVKFQFLAIRGAPRQCHTEVLQVETCFRNRGHNDRGNDFLKTEDKFKPLDSIARQGTTDVNQGEHSARATIVPEPDVHSRVAGGFIILCGPWRAADEWNTVIADKDSLRLKDKDHDDGIVTCYFDIASPGKIEQWSQIRNTYGFLHISSTGIPTRSEGQVMALILESTLRASDEYRRVGIAFMSFKMVDNASQSWRKRTVMIV